MKNFIFCALKIWRSSNNGVSTYLFKINNKDHAYCSDNSTVDFPQNKFIGYKFLNPLCANPTKWSNTLKQFVGKSRRIV